MRFGLILLCAGLLSAQPSQSARDKCRLEGKVLNAATGEPVRKVQVVLTGMPTLASRPAPGQTFTPPAQLRLAATTDSEGRFVFEGLEAGRYTVMANRDGFQNPAATAVRRMEPILLASGEEKRDLTLRMEPLSVISGRVRDEDGDPVRRAQVNVMTYQYTAKGRELTNRNSASTNDLGEYRIFDLQPGKYYVKVTAVTSRSSLLPGSNEDSYAPAFYPGARDATSASVIDLRPGQEQSGTDITLRRTRTVTVSGRLVKPVGALQTSVRLAQMEPGSNTSTGGVSMDLQDGFRILQVLPGSYVLTADTSVGDKGYAARVPLQVAGTDIKDLVVALVPTFDMNGRVQIEGTPPAGRGGRGTPLMQAAPAPGSQISSPLSQIMFNVSGRFPRTSAIRRTADGSMIVSSGMPPRPNDDGTIVFKDLAPDIYTVSVNIGGPLYLKSMRCGNTEIGDLGIDLTGGSGCELSVVLSYNAGRIEGSVEDGNGQPAASAVLTLVPLGSIRKSVLFKLGMVTQQGSFTIQGIAPGAYKLYAWEDVDTNAVRYDPDFLKPYEALGQAVQISEGSSERVTVKLIKKPAEP